MKGFGEPLTIGLCQGRCDSMEKPEIAYELEVAHGSIYGFEETLAVIECLKDRALSCGKKVKQFEMMQSFRGMVLGRMSYSGLCVSCCRVDACEEENDAIGSGPRRSEG
jgi:hypothetical protein